MKFYQSAVLTGLLSLLATTTHAIVIYPNDLPSAISSSNCPNCYVDTTSFIDLPYMSVFYMTSYKASSGTYEQSRLIRHKLQSNSKLTSIANRLDSNGNTITTTTITPYQGYLWMEAPVAILNPNSPHQFNIYTDKITPDPDKSPINLYNDAPSTWSFTMPTRSVLAGGASHYDSGHDGISYYQTGNLSVLNGLFTCIECSINVKLNLIGLDYSSGIANFYGDDHRGLLLQYDDYFGSFGKTRNFSVSAVPLPAASWLFLSGLMGLLGLSRRRK